MRMQELMRRSGLSRQVIHYYIKQGYLHPPIYQEGKRAYYDHTHLDKLLFLKRSKEEGIPLPTATELWVREKRKNRPFRQRGVEGSATREQMIQTGTKIFLGKGYHQTTISDIVDSVGVTKASFYYYFDNKKDLFFTCLENIFKTVFKSSYDEIKQEKNPMKRWEIRWKVTKAYFPEIITILQLVKESLRDEDEEYRLKAEGMLRKSIIDPLVKDIDTGMQSGILQPVQSELIAYAIVSLLEMVAYRPLFQKDYSDADIQQTLSNLIVSGIFREGNLPGLAQDIVNTRLPSLL